MPWVGTLEQGMGGLRIAALGPLRAWHGERQLDTGPAQQRAVLTSLALRCGQVASADELVRDVWGSEPPASAHFAVRNHVSRLRTVLESESAAPKALVSVAGGYALRLPDGGLDVSQAERLHARAQSARSQGDLEPAVRLLTEAEALWDGTPLTGVPGPYAQRQRDRLMEYRLLLVEARLTLELQLGGHTRVVGELLTLADEHPLREELRALQMLALYRCGRQADALGAYTAASRHLAAELGVDPGPELVRLHQRILEADPTLAPPTGVAAASPAPGPAAGPDRPTWVPPAQSPPDIPDFTGRGEESRHVRDALAGAGRPDATAPVVCVIHGMGGVGKTALAVHSAHAVREQFPDGQLYVDLRGAGREPANPYEVQELFLRSLGVLAGNVPSGREERTALYRSRMAGRRLLLLLDNAADTEQVSPLLPGTAGSAALITSRTALMCLPATTRTALEPFSEPEALDLLERMAGSGRCRQEQQTASDLVWACGMLPLAVRVVGARLVARPRWTLATLAERLSDRSQRLGELEAGSLAVESVFHLSYSTLDDTEARAFRLLAIPEVPDLSPAAAAALLQCDRREAEGTPDTPHQGRWWEIVQKYGVTILYTAPTAIRACMKWGDDIPAKFDLSSLRVLGSVGEPINPEAWVWYREHIGGGRCPIVDTWWQTETGAMMLSPLPGVTATKPGSAQVPLPGISATVVDDDANEVPNGAGGYLVLTEPWPSMLRTIWGDDQRYLDTYWSRFEGKYFAGDGAKKDEDGDIWLLGRVDDVMLVSGHNISTTEVESALVSHPKVAEAAVVGATDPQTTQSICAFVILRGTAAEDEGLVEELRAHVAQQLGPIAKPKRILTVTALPTTRSGKIMRRLLRDVAENRALGDVSTLTDASVMGLVQAALPTAPDED